MTDLDPIDPTVIAPSLVAIPAGPTVWDDLPDGQVAYTLMGPTGEPANHATVWQRRDGVWHRFPWWQEEAADEFPKVIEHPDQWAYDLGHPRASVERTHGPLHPIENLPGTLWPDSERKRLVDKVRLLNETLHSVIGYVVEATDSQGMEWDVTVERLHYLREERDRLRGDDS